MIENMSMYVCRCCSDTVHLFGKDKGNQLARMMEIPFLGSIPIDPQFSEAADTGVPIVKLYPESVTAQAFTSIAATLQEALPFKEVGEAPPEVSRTCPGAGHHHHHHRHDTVSIQDHRHEQGSCCNHVHHH